MTNPDQTMLPRLNCPECDSPNIVMVGPRYACEDCGHYWTGADE